MISLIPINNVSEYLVTQADKGQRFLGHPLSLVIKCVPHT